MGMYLGRWRRFSSQEEAQGKTFGIALGTLGGGPLLLLLAKHHYGQLAATGRIVVRSKRAVSLIAGSDAYWLIGGEAVIGSVLLLGGLWWVRQRLRRFPH